MATYPMFRLDAVPHKDVASASKVFSLQEVEYFLFVRIDATIAKVFTLYQVDEITDEAEFVCPMELWEHDPGRIWYKFHTDKLNLTTGYHTYRLSFVNTYTNDNLLLYIAYVIQNNKPDKPYMYMDKENRKCNCNGTTTNNSGS